MRSRRSSSLSGAATLLCVALSTTTAAVAPAVGVEGGSSVSSSSSSSTMRRPPPPSESDDVVNNSKDRYRYLDMIMEQYEELTKDDVDDDDGGGGRDDLVHVPMRSRASVLRERGLLRLLEEETDEDAATTFARWAGGSGGRYYVPEGSLGRTTASSWGQGGGGGNGSAYYNDEDGGGERDDGGRQRQRMLQEFSGQGTHFIDAFVGSPAQKRVLAVSSGADFTAFPCEGCTQCGPTISPYRQTLSTSFLTMPCGRCVGGQRDDVCDSERIRCVARGYNLVDKSAWTAYEARDYVYVGGADAEIAKLGRIDATGTNVPEDHGFPLVFACQTEATGWYSSQVRDGIVGLSTARTSLVNQMVFQDKLKYPRYCMCFEQRILAGDKDDENAGRSAGVMTLGGYNPRILDAPLVYVQNYEEEGSRYKVHVRNIYFRSGGGQSIVPDRDGQAVVRLNFDEDMFNLKNGGTILDSGVPLLIFDESAQRSFLAEWKKMVGSDFTLGKMLLTENDVKALPTIIIQIKAHEGVDKSFNPRTVPNMAGDRDTNHPFDALLAVPATHYMEYNRSTGTYRAKITLDSKLGSFLGINAMQGHAFFYDLAKDRIGLAESYNCMPKMSPAGLVDDDMFELPTVQVETVAGGGPDNEQGPYDPGDGAPFNGGMPGKMPGVTPTYGFDGSVEEEDAGMCVTATCISFVTVGYCVVVIALAVAYRKHRPRDRSKQFDDHDGGEVEDDFRDSVTEVLNPEFEQHVRNTAGNSVRGSFT